MHRRYALWIPRLSVDVGSSLDQLARQPGMTKKDRQAHCRESILAIRPQKRRILFQELERPLLIPDRTRLGESQLGAPLHKCLSNLGMAVVNRQEDRRHVSGLRLQQRSVLVKKRRHSLRVTLLDRLSQFLTFHCVPSPIAHSTQRRKTACRHSS